MLVVQNSYLRHTVFFVRKIRTTHMTNSLIFMCIRYIFSFTVSGELDKKQILGL